MTEDTERALPAGDAPATGYLKVMQSADPYEIGAVVPDTPENRARLGANARPASAFETGVAGVMTREG